MENLPPLTKEARLVDIVCKGAELLMETKGYRQINLLHKLAVLNHGLSPASLSNILNGKKTGLQILKTAAEGIQAIVEQELGQAYDSVQRRFATTALPDWQPYIVPEQMGNNPAHAGMTLHLDGRVSIQQKTNFIASAQKTVLEVGVRLKTFSDYFHSRRDKEFKTHITALLQRGVTFQGYLLDPDSNEARLYFDDRQRTLPAEAEAVLEMKKVMEKLRLLVQEFEQQKYPGTFEIYLYKHIPYNHFLIVDPHSDGGKIMVSHYLYGVRRAECPVWEFTKSEQPALFRKYAASLEAYLRDARRLQ